MLLCVFLLLLTAFVCHLIKGLLTYLLYCNQNVFWSQNMAKMLWRPALGELAALPQTPNWILGRKDGEKKRRRRNVRKEGGEEEQKEGRGTWGKEEEGTVLISFAPQPLNPGDATDPK